MVCVLRSSYLINTQITASPPPQSFVRDMAHKQAVSPITSAPCDLDGMQQPSMKDGGDNWVEYIVQANDFSAYGIEASVLNCAISRCDASGGMSTSIVNPQMGHLMMRLSDGAWKKRFMVIPADSTLLEFNNPKNEVRCMCG